MRVRLRQGELQGVREGAVHRWRSIPYAQPPVGALRFAAPRPPQAWTGVRDGARGAPCAVQPLAGRVRGSEDCLYLNVTAPADAAPGLPVVVWLHGGGMRIGSGEDRVGSGASLALEAQVAVVTVNYRLGALGFLALGDGAPDAANAGLLDQIAALEWVAENIAAFGGDPAKLTVVGASAGAKLLGCLLSLPAVNRRITRAISMSGGADFVSEPAEAAELAARFRHALGLATLDLDRLRRCPASEILAAQERLADGVAVTWTWRPTVDGRTLTAPPLEAIAGGAARGVDLILGTARHEARLFSALYPGAERAAAGEARAIFGPRAAAVLGRYAELAGSADPVAVDGAFMTSERYRIPTIRLAEAQLAHARVWMYRFDFAQAALGPLATGHGSDAGLLWSPVPAAAERSPAAELGSALRRGWGAFAHHGTPQAGALAGWEAYAPERRMTMLLDVPPRCVSDPDRLERTLWTGVSWRPSRWAAPPGVA